MCVCACVCMSFMCSCATASRTPRLAVPGARGPAAQSEDRPCRGRRPRCFMLFEGITHIGGNAAHFNREAFGDIGLVLVLAPIPVVVLVPVLVLALVLVLNPKSFVLSSMS